MQKRIGRLDGKVAIVTGAGSSGPGVGTGKATSILFAREGARVLLVDRVPERAAETLAMISGDGGEASVFEADVTVAKECEAMVTAAKERYGGLHILINNVGIRGPGTVVDVVVDVNEEDWDRVLDTNLKSMMLSSKYAIPEMVENGGSIINLSSIAGVRASSGEGSASYGASKGGVIALTISMSVQHGRDNIRVSSFSPLHSSRIHLYSFSGCGPI